MECISRLRIEIDAPRAEQLIRVLECFQGWVIANEEADECIERAPVLMDQFELGMSADDFYEELRKLQTGLNTQMDGKLVVIDFWPDEVPEALCKWLFPALSALGAKRIVCSTQTEYDLFARAEWIDGEVITKESNRRWRH